MISETLRQSHESHNEDKEAQRREIARQCAEFCRGGGEIQIIPNGVSGFSPDRKRGKANWSIKR